MKEPKEEEAALLLNVQNNSNFEWNLYYVARRTKVPKAFQNRNLKEWYREASLNTSPLCCKVHCNRYWTCALALRLKPPNAPTENKQEKFCGVFCSKCCYRLRRGKKIKLKTSAPLVSFPSSEPKP